MMALSAIRSLAASAALLLTLALSGCGGAYLMPTPNLYADGLKDPFSEVPPALRNNRAEVLFLTDRSETKQSTDDLRAYGSGRSRSLAFGVATMQIGNDISWDELVRASTSRSRAQRLPLKVIRTTELARFEPTPKARREPASSSAGAAANPEGAAPEETEPAKEFAKEELARRLAECDVKDVYIFVHGYNNTFEDAVVTIGQLWHFMGRQGVPIAYSWPAGRGGLLRGYTYDHESSEFTIFHFKDALRTIAEVPAVHRVHIIAHSRGTDVVVSALRELNLKYSGAGRSTREELKLGSLVLAAPDLGFEVILQRNADGAVSLVPERTALYVCEHDGALDISNWLFSGRSRLGRLRADMFTPEELDAMREVRTGQIIEARISNPGPHGHSYFHSNPAVSSDVILIVRYGQLPGPERPLRIDPDGFWYIDDAYPAPAASADRHASAPS